MADKQVFQVSTSQLSQILKWTYDQVKKHNLTGKRLSRFELALEEAIVNVVNYAYPNGGGVLEIGVAKSQDGKYLQVTLKDQGIAFDPVTAEKNVDLDACTEERCIGGLGVHFMHELTDHLAYERKGGSNILTLSILTS